jgi:hypothetical protein
LSLLPLLVLIERALLYNIVPFDVAETFYGEVDNFIDGELSLLKDYNLVSQGQFLNLLHLGLFVLVTLEVVVI